MRNFTFSIETSIVAIGISGVFSLIGLMMGDKALATPFVFLGLMFLIQALLIARIEDMKDDEDYAPDSLSPLLHILNKAWCLWAVAVGAPFDREAWVILVWITVLSLIVDLICQDIGDMIHLNKKKREERDSSENDVGRLTAELVKSKRQQQIEDDLMADLGSFLSDVELPKDKK